MRLWLVIAGVNGAASVLAGAFAAHGLSARLSPDMLAVFDTAARYHLIHALAIGLAALAIHAGVAARSAAIAFLIGIVLFSGSLYLLALTGIRTLGIVTPFGGLALVAGWLLLSWAAWRRA